MVKGKVKKIKESAEKLFGKLDNLDLVVEGVDQVNEKFGTEFGGLKDFEHAEFLKIMSTAGYSIEKATDGEAAFVLQKVAAVEALFLNDPGKKAFKYLHDDRYSFAAFAGRMEKEDGDGSVSRFVEQRPIRLVGPTGSGKSTKARLFHQKMCRTLGREIPLYRINFSSGFDEASFIGHREVREVNGASITTFVYGILPIAMGATGRPGTLIIEELDAARGVHFHLHSVLENPSMLIIGDNNGEVVEGHPDFRIIATSNTAGRGDETGLYSETHQLNAAFNDRWLTFECPYPEDEWEIYEPSVGEDRAKKMEKFATLVRERINEGELMTTMSVRRIETFSELAPQWGLAHAFQHVILSGHVEDEQTILTEIAHKVFGEEF